MSAIQILGILFLLFAISRVILRWKDHLLPTRQMFFWSFIFLGILVILLAPELSSKIATFLGIARGADAIIYASIVFIYYLVFRIFVAIENLEHKLTTLIQQNALDKLSDTEK